MDKRKKTDWRWSRLCFLLLLLVFLPTESRADLWLDVGDTLSGTLTWTDGLSLSSGVFATELWAAEGTSFYYEVSRPAEGEPLQYFYRFTVPAKSGGLEPVKDLSHLTIEASDGSLDGSLPAFDWGNPLDYVNGPTVSDDGPGDDLGGRWGIKFEEIDELSPGANTAGTLYSWTIAFESYRLPMWGDFYAKDGKADQRPVYAYNTDFGNAYDPVDHPSKILVPDSSYVPVPGAVLLGLIGLGCGGLRLRRHS